MNAFNPFSLKSKGILITGASSGIGKAAAIECSKLGAELIITGRNEERLAETYSQLLGDNHRMVVGNLCEEDYIKALIDQLPVLDGAFLCAGIADTTLAKFMTRKKIDRVFDTNFISPVQIVRLLLKQKKLNNGGSIVLMSSAGGTTMFNPGNGIYGASKAALSSFSRFVALECAPQKIRVNSICAAMVESPLLHNGSISEEQLKTEVRQYPLKRLGTVEEIAYAAIYFLSDASAWVTGTSFLIDGGASLI